ncbi:MAG TPA: AtpZ/AtpI family protein [Candidatus Aminicenantes bacterium]|nr:AtpZ/AtpI family protein [Candidatus Aminicenantes bacterium]
MADYSTIGLMFPTSISVGFFLGYLLDGWLHTSPWLLVAGTLYGMAAGFIHLYRTVKRHESR